MMDRSFVLEHHARGINGTQAVGVPSFSARAATAAAAAALSPSGV